MLDNNTVQTEEVLDDAIPDATLQEEVDYSSYQLTDFKKLTDKLLKEASLSEQYHTYKKLKPYIDSLFEIQKNAALDVFINDGGDPDDFQFKADPFFKKFEEIILKSKKEYFQVQKDTQKKKEENYKHKKDILEKMRAILDKPETRKAYEDFKILQTDWKNIGPVPAENSEEVWKSYNSLVSRFYDLRSISFELLELDRKRNLELKIALCEKAEQLIHEQSLKKALHELEIIHDEFRHLGPVPRDRQDEIWQRLKDASDAIYKRRKEYTEQQNLKLSENHARKTEIIEKLKAYQNLELSRADDWAAKTKEVELLQSEWAKAGLVPKEMVKETNHLYWDLLKNFYTHKRNYFKAQDNIKKENLRLKTVLCEKAEALAENTEWEISTPQIIQLQKEWKEIGHVPIKFKDKIYERFKKACDTHFENKRKEGLARQNAARDNLKSRFDFCDNLEKNPPAIATKDDVENILTQWTKISPPEEEGPDAHKAWNKLASTLRHVLANVKTIDEIAKDEIVSKIMIKAAKLLPNADSELLFKEKKLRKDIRDIEDTIAQYNNNMEFFARAKNGESIRKEFIEKIAAETDKLKIAKARLKILLDNK